MNSAEARLTAARQARDAARAAFETRRSQVSADLEAKGVAMRMAESVGNEMSDVIDVGVDVARERKGILAGTIGAVLLWLFKEPLVAKICEWAAEHSDEPADDSSTAQNEEEPQREPVHEQA